MKLKKYIITASKEALLNIMRYDKSLVIEFKSELWSNMYVIKTSLRKEVIENTFGVEKVEENYEGTLLV
jgi:hypothetical protein